jgi:hypothetical protein
MTKSQTGEEALLPASIPSRVFSGGKRVTGQIILGLTSGPNAENEFTTQTWSGPENIRSWTTQRSRV